MVSRLIALLLAAFGLASPAIACMCDGGAPPPCEVLYTTEAVFAGTVKKVDSAKTVFAVDTWLAGKNRRSTVELDNQVDCAMQFVVGRRYVVYADRAQGSLVAMKCGRNESWGERIAGAEDIEYARHPPNRTRAVVDGKVVFSADKDVHPSVRVTARNTDGSTTQSTEVNSSGAFHLDLAPGTYELVAEGEGLATSRAERIRLPVAAACAKPQLRVDNGNRIEGTVRNLDGSPAVQVTVTIVAPNRTARELGQSTRTDRQGHYEFHSVKPGEYLVGATVEGDPRGVFYPEARDEAHARPIIIGGYVRQKTVDITLPAPR